MCKIRLTEAEKGSSALLKKASSLPDQFIPVSNEIAFFGNERVSINATLFQKLLEMECIAPCDGGYKLTKLGAKMAELK